MSSPPASQTTVRVLVVDDDADFRVVLRALLQRSDGVEVIAEAEDGRSALELAERHRPHVVLLDLLMPVLDGYEALPQLAARVPDARIIVLTALEEQEAAGEVALVGAAAFLEKRHAPRLLLPLVLEGADDR